MSIKDKYLRHISASSLLPTCLMGGDEDAEIAIIGEYPTAQDASLSTPFSGASGKILWNTLRNQKINRTQCYTTYAIKRQVSKKDGVQLNESTLWQESLQYEISELKNLKLIICLGNVALNFLIGFDGITQYRGSVYEFEGVPVVIGHNPTMTIRNPETEIIFAMDIQKALRVYNGDYKELQMNRIINPTYDQSMNYMDQIRRQHKKFSMDIEVTGYETACIGLGISANEAMCINFRDKTSNVFTEEQEYNLLQSFVKTCDQDDTFVIAQNGNFDSYFMGFKDNAKFDLNFDTLLAHHTLYPRLPHNLGFLTSQYVDFPYYKDEKDSFKEGGSINDFWNYNCTDCCVTFAVYEAELKELQDQGLDEFFLNHVMQVQPELSESTTTGVLVDVERKEELHKVIGQDVMQLRQDVIDKAKEIMKDQEYHVNPGSSKQLCKFLYDDLGLKSYKRSADVHAREKLMEDPRTGIDAKDFLTKLGNYNEESKFFSTYVSTNIDPDDRFRAEFKQYGVSKAPGRLSSAKTLWGSGGNAQNQPHRAYEMYMPDEGCVFIYFDLAQAEARYVAWDAWIEQWIEDFERARIDGSFDAHRSLAATMFSKKYEDTAKKDHDEDGNFTERYIAKRCRHGLNYRMHIHRLAQTTGLNYAEAASNYYLYHRTNPELARWWKDIEKEIRRNRKLFNAYGRRFITLERLENSNIMDSIIAFKPQSTIGDKTQRVWYQCHQDPRWDKHKARIALNVHDALYGISTPSFAKTALSIMKKYAEEPIMVRRTKDGKVSPMIVPADCKISFAGENDGKHRMSNMMDIDIIAAA